MPPDCYYVVPVRVGLNCSIFNPPKQGPGYPVCLLVELLVGDSDAGLGVDQSHLVFYILVTLDEVLKELVDGDIHRMRLLLSLKNRAFSNPHPLPQEKYFMLSQVIVN